MAQEQSGSIRGLVYDRDFEVPLGAATIQIVETGGESVSTDQGNYVLGEVPPGTYTLICSKLGYVKGIKSEVVVTAGQLAEVDFWLSGDFVDMEEFVVQDMLGMNMNTEAGLLQLRFESPALMDSISADLMSRAGASDAASALKLVSGASIQGGKFAVIRGLPDRYVSSQMNGVRLPSADEDTRAVELDQFPSAVIESLRVSKTFTPDQQGDASGGAVDVRLKGIPEDGSIQFTSQVGYNDQATEERGFLTFRQGGGQPQPAGASWTGDVGVSDTRGPWDHKWSASAGGQHEVDDSITVGGFASFFYERDNSFYDNGVQDSFWAESAGAGLTPQKGQNTSSDQFNTSLFDVTRGQQSEEWGGLATIGVETEDDKINLVYLMTRNEEDTATLAQDVRGKEWFFGPNYDPGDTSNPGNSSQFIDAAPYLRTETLEHTERSTSTLQLTGSHVLRDLKFDSPLFSAPELDWTISRSNAKLDQPDKRQFGAKWQPEHSLIFGGVPVFTFPDQYSTLLPSDNTNLGNLQRIWKRIEEESQQYAVDYKMPFDRDDESHGYIKVGLFNDQVERKFGQESFTNANDFFQYQGSFDDSWSGAFPDQIHPLVASEFDVDYDGGQDITAWYTMVDFPVTERVNVIAGARVETTEIGVVHSADANALWWDIDNPVPAPIQFSLDPTAPNVDFRERHVLPSLSVIAELTDELTVRAAYSQTIARQTFKELSPVVQQEFLGGPIFIGSPRLQMSQVENYDLRVDYEPVEGSLLSMSWFKKDIDDAIEYVQTGIDFTYTTPVNYPKGKLSGYEVELRQKLANVWEAAEDFSVGVNATFIDSRVTLRDKDAAELSAVGAPIATRDMTNAPEHLYNVFVTWDSESSGTQASLFYTLEGDSLVQGAGVVLGNFVPSVYAQDVGTLNFSVSQKLGKAATLQFKAKNLTNPKIDEVYRSPYTAGDVTRTSYTRGREYTLSLAVRF
ncbi:MAG: TonB-dependent receptor [Pseudohongiellaceae bacterium]|jgi:TonB-dependent receptor